MAVAFYTDKHVKLAVTKQLKRRAVDVLTVAQDGTDELADEDLLVLATRLGRVMVTQDIGFKALAENWQRESKHFSGLIYAHQLRASVGQLVNDLELIAKASEPEEWAGRVEHLPYSKRK